VPQTSPKAQVDLQDLSLHEGATVLLRRGIASVDVGERLEVLSRSVEVDENLAAWCRGEGHQIVSRTPPTVLGGNAVYLIERGAPPPQTATDRKAVEEAAEPAWGLAPRGARIEAGGPAFSFPLHTKRQVWAEELESIYKQAVSNQWSASRDVPWGQLEKLDPAVEAAVCQVMTFLTENEFAALYVPARFIPRIHPHYREVVEVLAMQVVDEARHAEAFTRRAEAGGLGLGTTAVSGQLSLQTLVEEPDFTTAAFLLCVMGEGTFLSLLKFIETHAPDAVTASLARLAHRDEARHVAFGVSHLRYVLEREPERRASLALAVERRSRMLASVSGLSPYVHDAMVVMSAGGVSPAQIRQGAARVAELHREMDRSRRERLLSLGFDEEQAATLSAYHTKNFM